MDIFQYAEQFLRKAAAFRKSAIFAFRVIASLTLFFLSTVCTPGGAEEITHEPPADTASIRADMERVITFMDGPAYAKSVSDSEHIVLSYQWAQDRQPTPEEFIVLSGNHDYPLFKRSEILAVALRGNDPSLTWERCRQFLTKQNARDFRGSPETRTIAEELEKTSLLKIQESTSFKKSSLPAKSKRNYPQETTSVPGETYNVYFGYVHAHSDLSDGSGTPEEAYAYARDEGHLDFFSLTDHAEQLQLWPWTNKWQRLKNAAEAVYAPGTFVSLWGFEWANPLVGHINVLNSNGLTSLLDSFFLPEFYAWLETEPEAFGTFNHPGNCDDFGAEFRHMAYFENAAQQIVGIETANGSDSFERYYYSEGWETSYSYWDEGNLNGWKLGPVIGQDNHGPDWGTKNPWRTAVLARELTREAIIDAYRQRRFYATEDPGLRLDFRCAGYPMGSSLQNAAAEFTVEASTNKAAAFEAIRLFRNGELLKTQVVSGNPVQAVFSDPEYTESAYYYVIVTETVDTDNNGRNDEAISAPIWIGEPWDKPCCGGVSVFSQPAGNSDMLSNLLLVFISMIVLGLSQKMLCFSDNNGIPKKEYK